MSVFRYEMKRWAWLLAVLVIVGWDSAVPAQQGDDPGEPASILKDGPIAWFAFSPANPKPGELITFDASPSQGEGGIISFQWDTTGSGRHDRAGSVIRHSFDGPGEYPVTLAVHDTLGRVGRVTRVVRIGGPGRVNLSIETNPPGLTVYIDGERRGRTPIDLSVEPGERHIRLRHYWRGTWETTIDLSDVRSFAFQLDLWDTD